MSPPPLALFGKFHSGEFMNARRAQMSGVPAPPPPPSLPPTHTHIHPEDKNFILVSSWHNADSLRKPPAS